MVSYQFKSSNGDFAMDRVAPGAYQLFFELPSAGPLESEGTTFQSVEVESGQTLYLDLMLDVPLDGSIFGAVLDADGSPVADAVVQARTRYVEPQSYDPNSQNSTLSDVRGRYSMHGLRRDRTYTVVATAAGRGEVDVEPSEEEVTLRLSATGTLAGLVTSTSGDRPAQLHVDVGGQHVERRESFIHTGGEWRMNDLPVDQYRVKVGVGNYIFTQWCEVRAGETELIELTVPRAVTLRARLFYDDGKPMAWSDVLIEPLDVEVRVEDVGDVTTDEEGWLEAEVLVGANTLFSETRSITIQVGDGGEVFDPLMLEPAEQRGFDFGNIVLEPPEPTERSVPKLIQLD